MEAAPGILQTLSEFLDGHPTAEALAELFTKFVQSTPYKDLKASMASRLGGRLHGFLRISRGT
eukprot:4194028-Pyramimonas_sp.AAC.1